MLSITEANLIATTNTYRELQWVKRLLGCSNIQEILKRAIKTNIFLNNFLAVSIITMHDNYMRLSMLRFGIIIAVNNIETD